MVWINWACIHFIQTSKILQGVRLTRLLKLLNYRCSKVSLIVSLSLGLNGSILLAFNAPSWFSLQESRKAVACWEHCLLPLPFTFNWYLSLHCKIKVAKSKWIKVFCFKLLSCFLPQLKILLMALYFPLCLINYTGSSPWLCPPLLFPKESVE